MASDLQTKATSNAITMDLQKLFVTTSRCEECISVLGTDKDTLEFRQKMTTQIKNATLLCRSIKRNFNRITHVKHIDIDVQTLQQRFISLHSELRSIVHRIKSKTTQYEALNARSECVNDVAQKEKQHKDTLSSKDTDSKYVVNRKQILKEGWLMKKSRHLKKWRKRWVVIDSNTEDITLFTFKHEKEYIHPTETVVINDGIQIKQIESTKNEFILYNQSNKCKFIFKTLGENNTQWIQILENEWKYNGDPLQNIQNVLMHKQHQIANGNSVDMDINDMESMNDNEEYLSFCIYNENESENVEETDEKEDMILDDNSLHNSDTLYDKTNSDVQDCLVLIDDLTYLRDEQDVDSANNRIISDFEHSLKVDGFVTKEQIDNLKDVSITLISFMLDKPEPV